MWALSTPCLRAAAGGTVLLCSPGDPSCPPGSDLQSSHCTLGEAFEDLDWETEKGLEAVACDTEGFVPPKVMVRSGRLCPVPIPAGPGLVGAGSSFFFQEPNWLYLHVIQPQGLPAASRGMGGNLGALPRPGAPRQLGPEQLPMLSPAHLLQGTQS